MGDTFFIPNYCKSLSCYIYAICASVKGWTPFPLFSFYVKQGQKLEERHI